MLKVKAKEKLNSLWFIGLMGLVIFAVSSTDAKRKNRERLQDKRKTTINFEDELIQGKVKKPELFYLLQKKQFNFKRLIKLRENFLPEMRRTSEDIKRGRSKD